jgi:uncharacterized membrane protein
MGWLDWLKEYYFFNFFALYVLGGRTAALLSAQWLGQSLLFFFPLVVLLDIVQIPLFYRAYEGLLRLSFLSRVKPWLERRRESVQQSGIWRVWSAWKGLGVFLITLVPVKGGGMWSGVLMAFSLKIPKRASYPILIGGSVAGCLLLLGLGETLGYLWP